MYVHTCSKYIAAILPDIQWKHTNLRLSIIVLKPALVMDNAVSPGPRRPAKIQEASSSCTRRFQGKRTMACIALLCYLTTATIC